MMMESPQDGVVNLAGASPAEVPNDPGKMFIGGLSWQTSPESLREYFSKYGEITEVMVMKDPTTRRSR
ncbi:RNA-binding protein Musashi homolog Rbp6 isoform X2 [Frankliniella occidentalis]|uniref:RNA-binding protein Musashi homolog Rbp6 isoform X2 n=1 Tax=Frankliniella occidentalis TaxID=133901 RepID=A0A9C6U2N1_FRAOC|nr:RNA-binding protein Musashi homolog Rbp6 isoform X2 [Frankliniella occidentalis]